MKKRKLSQDYFFFFLGLFIAFIFTYVVVKHIDGKNKNDSFKPFFPFFNFSYIMILVLTLMGINMKVLQYYKINYVYLLDLNPKNKINPYGVFEGVLGLAALWMFFFFNDEIIFKIWIIRRAIYFISFINEFIFSCISIPSFSCFIFKL